MATVGSTGTIGSHPNPLSPTPASPSPAPPTPTVASASGPSTVGTPAPTGSTSSSGDRSALAQVNATLAQYGLDSLGEQAWTYHLNGWSDQQIVDWIKTTQAYKDRFSGLLALQQKGRAITETDYIAKERADAELFRSYGLPDSYANNRQLLGTLIGNEVSTSELDRRLAAAQKAAMAGVPAETRAYLSAHFGVTDGDWTHFWLDPTVAVTDIERKANAAVIGGAATRGGYGLDTAEALRLADLGVNGAGAADGFSKVNAAQQLATVLPGEQGTALTQQQLVEGVLGVGDTEALRLAAARRAAVFGGGGGFSTGRAGIAGLGSAAT